MKEKFAIVAVKQQKITVYGLGIGGNKWRSRKINSEVEDDIVCFILVHSLVLLSPFCAL